MSRDKGRTGSSTLHRVPSAIRWEVGRQEARAKQVAANVAKRKAVADQARFEFAHDFLLAGGGGDPRLEELARVTQRLAARWPKPGEVKLVCRVATQQGWDVPPKAQPMTKAERDFIRHGPQKGGHRHRWSGVTLLGVKVEHKVCLDCGAFATRQT